jgi:hypothetical protein
MPLDAHRKAIITTTPIVEGREQAQMDVAEFNALIQDKGYKCIIERALQCPCLEPATGNASADCLNCGGTGWFFVDKTDTVLKCTNMNNRNKYEAWNPINLGIVNISCRGIDRLGFMDKVTVTELEMWFTQVLKFRKTDTKVFVFTTYNPLFISHAYAFLDTANPLSPIDESLYTIYDNRIEFDFATFSSVNYDTVTIKYTFNPVYHIIDVNRDMIKQKTIEPCGTVDGSKVMFPLSCVGRLAQYVFEKVSLNNNSLYDNTVYGKTPIAYDKH